MARLTMRRGAISALAIAGSTSLLLTATPAGATGTHAPAYYAGSASGDVLGLTLKLPTALPNLPNPLQIGLVHVDGKVLHDPQHIVGNTVGSAESTASLASGTLVDSLQKTLHVAINRVAHVELGKGATSQSTSLLDIPAKPVADLSVGSLSASLNKVTDAALSAADGVSATLGTADDLLGKATVDAVSSTLQPLVDQLQQTVNQILGQLSNVGGSNPVVQTVTDTVNTILSKVQTLVANLGTTPLVGINVHDTSQTIAPSGNGAQAQSKLGLVSVDLLGGLLSVTGFSSGATAFANGLAHGAHVTSFATKPIVKVDAADALCAQLTVNGISLCKSSGLPASIQQQVNNLLAQLSGQLTKLESTLLKGTITIGEVPGTSHVDSAGRFASVTAPSYGVNLANVARLTLGSGVTASVSATQAAPAKVKAAAAAPKPQAPAPPVQLPHTGANLGLIGAVALLLLGGAAVLRRRFLGGVVED